MALCSFTRAAHDPVVSVSQFTINAASKSKFDDLTYIFCHISTSIKH